MKRPFYNLVIQVGELTIYWNRVLQRWVKNPSNASPFGSEEDIFKPLPFGVVAQKVGRNEEN